MWVAVCRYSSSNCQYFKLFQFELVKHFRAHLGNVQDIALNHNGTLLATVSNDKMAKIFDVVNFDMINIIKLGEQSYRISQKALDLGWVDSVFGV